MTETQDQQELRERLRQQLGPAFEKALDEAVKVYAQARVGRLIDDTEEGWDQVLKRLAEQVQQGGLQQRVEQIEADFSPSGQETQAQKQRRR